MKRLNWGFLLAIFLSIALWILFLSLICCSSLHAPAPVAFYGHFFFLTTVDGTSFTVWVENVSHEVVYNVVATMLILKDDMIYGGFTLEYDLIPPGEIEKMSSKRFRDIVFTDNIRLKGTLKWE